VKTESREDYWVAAFIAAMGRNAKERAGLAVKTIADGHAKKSLSTPRWKATQSRVFASFHPSSQSSLPRIYDRHRHVRKVTGIA